MIEHSDASSSPTSVASDSSPTANTIGQAMPLLWLLAALCLSNAIQAKWGFYTPAAIAWVGLGCAFAIASTLVSPQTWSGRRAGGVFYGVLGAALFWQLYQMNGPWPLAGFEKPVPVAAQQVMFSGISVGALLALFGFIPMRTLPGFHVLRFWTLLLAHVVVGVVLIRVTPVPPIDVWHVQQDASRALLQGINPYGITIPEIDGVAKYSPEIQHDGIIWFGYCYLPGSLLMVVPSVALLGDPRYAHLLAIVLSAVLMAFSRGSRISFAAASVFLFTPRLFFVLERSWTEPFVLLALSLMVFCACRASKRMAPALALLLTTKQYVVFALPMLWLLRTRLSLRQFSVSVALAAAVTLPFVLWNPGAFWHSAVAVGRWFSLRQTSLSFAVWLDQHGVTTPSWLVFALAGAASLWLGWRWSRPAFAAHRELAPSLFVAATAMVWLAFFCFAQLSFCNYYFLVIGALCLAVAAWPQSDAEPQVFRATTKSDEPIGR